MTLDRFNAAPTDELTPRLLACCDVPSWAGAVLEQRPYDGTGELLEVADAAARRFTTDEVDRALQAHPRIGERASGASSGAAWSRQEQSGVDRDAAAERALADGNRAYEQRFERVFLVCAAGRSAEEILANLQQRLGNNVETEDAVVKDELRKIALLRLDKLVEEMS